MFGLALGVMTMLTVFEFYVQTIWVLNVIDSTTNKLLSAKNFL